MKFETTKVPALCGLLLSVVALLCATGCGNECDFRQRCNGNVVETCGAADQMFNRTVSTRECADPNPVCVTFGPRDDYARCVREPAETCEEGSPAVCDGAVRVGCSPGTSFASCGDEPCTAQDEGWYLTGTDCSQGGPSCIETEDSAVCAREPVVTCDDATFVPTCEEGLLVVCREGLVAERQCSEGLVCGVDDEGDERCILE